MTRNENFEVVPITDQHGKPCVPFYWVENHLYRFTATSQADADWLAEHLNGEHDNG